MSKLWANLCKFARTKKVSKYTVLRARSVKTFPFKTRFWTTLILTPHFRRFFHFFHAKKGEKKCRKSAQKSALSGGQSLGKSLRKWVAKKIAKKMRFSISFLCEKGGGKMGQTSKSRCDGVPKPGFGIKTGCRNRVSASNRGLLARNWGFELGNPPKWGVGPPGFA